MEHLRDLILGFKPIKLNMFLRKVKSIYLFTVSALLIYIVIVISSCNENSGEFGKQIKSVSYLNSDNSINLITKIRYNSIELPIEIVDSSSRGSKKRIILYEGGRMVKVGEDTLIYESDQLKSISRFIDGALILIAKFIHQDSKVIKRTDFDLGIKLADFDSLETSYVYDLTGKLIKKITITYPTSDRTKSEIIYEYDSKFSPYVLWPDDLNLYFNRVSVINNEIKVIVNGSTFFYEYKYNMDDRPINRKQINFTTNFLEKFEYY